MCPRTQVLALSTARTARFVASILTLLALAASAAGCGGPSRDSLSAELGGAKVADSAGALGRAGPTAPATSQPMVTASTATAKELARVTAVATPNSNAYKIGPEDVIELTVFKVPDLSKSVQVSEAGTANLPLVGEIQVAGRTTREVEKELTATLGQNYLRNPQVNVAVKEYNSQRITIEGEVKKPGVFPIRGRLTLLQAVATAGGFESVADSSEILIFRSTNGRTAAAKFDIDQIRAGTSKDPELLAGDVIVVSSSTAKVAFQNILKALPLTSVFIGLL